MNWQAMLASTVAFFIGVWCGTAWQRPFLRIAERAEKERDHYKQQYIELHKRTLEVIEQWERMLKKAGYKI